MKKLLLALLVVVSSLVVSGGTANAAPAPCTVGYGVGGGVIPGKQPADPFGFTWFDIAVPDTRVVADVDFVVDLTVPEAGQIGLRLTSQTASLDPSSRVDVGRASGATTGIYAFDDEAATAYSGANPAPGRYQPTTPLTVLEGKPAIGTWRLGIANINTSPGTLRSVSINITYATCDTDGDGVEDKVDNCTVPNADQANRDGDAFGDVCDVDRDGDLVLNEADGCAEVGAATTTGCPPADRTATLKRRKKKLTAIVGSAVAGCRAGAEVTLLRDKKKGRDAKVLLARTDARGRVVMRAPRRAGRYYVSLRSSYAVGQAECAAAESKRLKVRRR